ncbi:PREDICTED: DEAD-box ATP-dependent RNA helicase 57 [Brassica oleracea var. oleracea]|uniref:RNA helicase n=1 Tax=Brassica oleracea var. oleracea TaxID=109376 RepID=A0A0D3AEV0_BRAOL|nr:PREDICTED: DEAD-box ATP-dependent RNA helicase 57 [Brassica oleracea var. oleracea]
MEKSANFLFGGTNFNRKKFAPDFAKFKNRTVEDDDRNKKLSFFEQEEESEEEPEQEKIASSSSSSKKRKRKSANSEPVEGFDVFKSSKKSRSKGKEVEHDTKDETLENPKKELYRRMEQDALSRKQYNIHVSGNNIPSPLKSFTELASRYGCKKYILRNLAELGFKEPTPIQRQAIPILLSGRECFACAPTGSGKTFAFICPMLIKLKRHSTDGIRAVILSPARELAAQTAREGKKLIKGSKFNIRLMTKPLVKTADFSKLQCDVLISTPMRLKRAIKAKKIDLSKVEYLVLDESDKLFEQSMLKQIDGVVKACSNPSIIRSLFSATLPDSVEELARSIMHDAVRVIIGRKNTASETVKQKLVFAGTEEGKLLALRQSFAQSLNPPVLIFMQSKERAKQLYDELKCEDIRVGVIHSDLPPGERENAVDSFRAGETWVLIATDVIARGMDFKGINCVINYDFPDSASAYIHRIGRSGRAGRSGEAITFYTEEDVPFLKNIANTMTSSGCEVPSWIMTLKKKKWKKHRPKRDSISTRPKDSKIEQEE